MKSLFASSPNSPLRIADGALNPELDVLDVNVTFLPFKSAGELIGLSAVSYTHLTLPTKA